MYKWCYHCLQYYEVESKADMECEICGGKLAFNAHSKRCVDEWLESKMKFPKIGNEWFKWEIYILTLVDFVYLYVCFYLDIV